MGPASITNLHLRENFKYKFEAAIWKQLAAHYILKGLPNSKIRRTI
jgi:hypothetical protein